MRFNLRGARFMYGNRLAFILIVQAQRKDKR